MPGLIFINRATMTLIYNNQIKEIGRKLLIHVIFFIVICKSLIQRKIYFIRLIYFLLFDNCQLVLKMFEITLLCLDNQVVSVCKI